MFIELLFVGVFWETSYAFPLLGSGLSEDSGVSSWLSSLDCSVFSASGAVAATVVPTATVLGELEELLLGLE